MQAVAAAIRRLAGIAAAMLPSRHWPDLDRHVPASSSAFAASLLTFLAGAAIGISGFLAFATEQASLNTKAVLDAAANPGVPDDALPSTLPMAMNALSLFTFLVATPAGWAAMYLGFTGAVRAAGAAFDDPRGDAILAAVDFAVSRGGRTLHDRQARATREALEGPDVPDRVVPGASLGLASADLVIVAARRKAGWDEGTIVLTGDTPYRLGRIEERTIAGRLRTLYPLTEHRDLEVFRRTVRYDLPAGR